MSLQELDYADQSYRTSVYMMYLVDDDVKQTQISQFVAV